MAQVSFGTILRNARNQKGYDLTTVARRLRIRPDILEAIEDGDFSRMPPRGYTRNMVNAYARYLGLNPTEITHKYLDEFYANQVHVARAQTKPDQTGFDLPTTKPRRNANAHDTGHRDMRNSPYSAPGRTMESDYRSSAGGPRSTRFSERVYPESSTRKTNRGALPTTQYTNFYSGPKATSSMRSRLPFIIGGIVIVVLLVIILVLIFGPKDSSGDNAPNVPVTGISEEGVASGSIEDDTVTDQGAKTARAPIDFTFTYQVADGATTWIEVWIDGVPQIAESVSGPTERTFRCSGTLNFITANSTVVTVYQDGVQLPLSPDSGGVVNLTINFADVLAQWNAENAAAA